MRDAIKQNNEESELINELIKEGKIVPVRITCNLLKTAMDKSGGPVIVINIEKHLHSRWIPQKSRKSQRLPRSLRRFRSHIRSTVLRMS